MLVAGCAVALVLTLLPLMGVGIRPLLYVYALLVHAPVVIVAGALLWPLVEYVRGRRATDSRHAPT